MAIKRQIKRILNRLPYISSLYKENMYYKESDFYPPGHYHSPIISVDKIRKRKDIIWQKTVDSIPGIDLKTGKQAALAKEFEMYYEQMPFDAEKKTDLRYYFNNNYYSYTDGIILYSFLRHFKPNRIIEVGSGFSSALMLDTNELNFNNSIKLRFIEPYPERLESLIMRSDNANCRITTKDVQDVPVSEFSELSEGDFLFIDSSHVSKTGSDVNYLLFNVLPSLNPGIIIQFHDIFYPFEYPEEWVIGGRNWNEIYLLRAFLTDNKNYEILFFSQYMHEKHPETFARMPLAYLDRGANFWLRKIN
jgi:predicted O-methyltransferase YrrM